jgi:hypothetical protein
LKEAIHGDLSEQAERWLTEPERTELHIAVTIAGVGGTVRRNLYEPTDLVKTSWAEYRVVKINRCSVRLQRTGNLSEELLRWDSREAENDWWSVVETVGDSEARIVALNADREQARQRMAEDLEKDREFWRLLRLKQAEADE